MSDWFQSLLPQLQHLGIAGYWLLALATFGESFFLTGMFIPGTVLLVIMGGLVPANYYDFADLVLFAVIGSILGDGASYESGRLGRFHVDRYAFLKTYLVKGRAYFAKHGGKSVIMGRFIGPIRPIIPFVAGVSEMRRSIFYMYNILSAFGWSILYLSLGYIFGVAWKSALTWSSAIVTIVVMTIVTVYVANWYTKSRKDPL